MPIVENPGSCCLPAQDTDINRDGCLQVNAGEGQARDKFISLAGGWFRMGADDGPHPEDGEGPAREVFVDPFALAATAVTFDAFSDFVSSTGYRTLAERIGTSFVFFSFCDRDTRFPAPEQAPWWRHVPGACWHAPNGPEISAKAQGDHPVTHIAREDALAYCRWSGTRLPTEAEWEFAARGPLIAKPFPWGDALEQDSIHRSNVWQGTFPTANSGEDGYKGTAPVEAFGPQGFGLFNMTGNVWEWVMDRFTTLHSPRPVRNPKGPLNGSTCVTKGGSYLCHASYCARYRTSSRQSLGDDATTGNLGFRVAARRA